LTNVVKSFGAQMFIWPHGLCVDREATSGATDAAVQTTVKDRPSGAQDQAYPCSSLSTRVPHHHDIAVEY